MRTNEIKNKIDETKKWEVKTRRKDLKYEINVYIYIYIYNILLFSTFWDFETIRYFGDNIYTCKITMNKSERDQSNLLENMVEFNDNSWPQSKEGKTKRYI